MFSEVWRVKYRERKRHIILVRLHPLREKVRNLEAGHSTMENRPSKAISLVSVFWMDWCIEDWDMLLVVPRHLRKVIVDIDWILNSLSESVAKQGSHIVIDHNPNCIAASPSTFIHSILDESVVWRYRSEAFVPLHSKVNLVSCDRNYSCEVEVFVVEKRFVVKFVR